MPVDRAFLRPMSVREPPQGDFSYLPVVKLYESDTLAGLQAQLDAEFPAQAAATTELWVIERVEHHVTVVKLAIGATPGEMLFTALVWATKVEKV